MIKLISSDVDGTILTTVGGTPSEQLFEQIRLCKQKGILFAVASGRQYQNMYRLFHPVKDDIIFVAENGALVMYQGRCLFSRGVPKEIGRDIIRQVLSTEDHELLLCCRDTCYLQPKQQSYLTFMLYELGNTVTVVEDALQVADEWLKISAYVPNDRASQYVQQYKQQWDEQLYVALAGPEWVDFGCASKGTALRHLQKEFGISKEETLSIGDNFNDIEMFNASGTSYAMPHSALKVQQSSTFIAQSVVKVLETVLAAQTEKEQ